MEIAPFAIERWYERYEFTAELHLSSSDCESRPLGDLLDLAPDARDRLERLWLGYTEVPGAPSLRGAIAATTETATPDDVIVLAAAEEGIFTFWHALLRSGDRAVVETPCYGSALEVARSTGADVRMWERRFVDGWAHDLDALEQLLRDGARALYVNGPHNPTGTQMSRETFDRVVELCREHGVALFSDEVYRGLEHDASARLPLACDALAAAVSLGSVSKTYGLPGLRLGWLITRDEALREAIVGMKLYTTICSSAPSELLVELAVSNGEQLIGRNRELVLRNLPLVDALVARHADLLSWVRPTAGPIGFPRWHGVADTTRLCERIVEEAGVLLLPGGVYKEPGHVRLGFGRADVETPIARLEDWLEGSRPAPVV
jgi:aspartate/methionine/tyrosine aminotransferase